MVFIFNPLDETLWLISHQELFDDLSKKYENNSSETDKLIKCLYAVCKEDGYRWEIILKNLVIVKVM
jgi:hypothetical protein